jgi:hypothetical protein
VPSFLGEEDAKDLIPAIRADLLDVATEMPCSSETFTLDLAHRTRDGGSIGVREAVDVFFHGSTPHLGAVVTPSTLDHEGVLPIMKLYYQSKLAMIAGQDR